MKPRNREINIFNLSMMDVISGAMGAFLILVVILSRHYESKSVTTEAIITLQRELVEATGHLDEASDEIRAGSRETADIERFLRRAKDNVNAGKAAIAGLRSDLDEANARITRLQEDLDDAEKELERRQPFFVHVHWSCDRRADVDIYLQSSVASTRGNHMPDYIPHANQGRFFSDEVYTDWVGEYGAEIWMHEFTTAGNRMKLYYGLTGDTDANCTLVGHLTGTRATALELPSVKLDATRPWVFAGTLAVDDPRRIRFIAATAAERRDEHARLAPGKKGS